MLLLILCLLEFGPATTVHVRRHISRKKQYLYIHIARRIPPVGDFFYFSTRHVFYFGIPSSRDRSIGEQSSTAATAVAAASRRPQ